MKKIFLIPFLLGSSLLSYAQSNDNTTGEKTYDLKEIVVKAKNAWIEGNTYVFIPQKRDKNLSNTMEDLIKRMHTGVLMVENDQITTRSGQRVSETTLPAD